MISRKFIIGICFFLAFIAACRPVEGDRATLPPTLTPTPFSTALPEIATAVPAGFPDNPIRMIIVPVDDDLLEQESILEVTEEPNSLLSSPLTQTEADLESAILDTSSVTIDVIPANRYADAISALCETRGADASVVWLDGLSYAVADAQNCGDPILITQREVGSRTQTGESGVIVVNRNLGSTNLTALNGRTFCRLGFDDFYSWLLPTLLFERANLDISTFEMIVDYEDTDALLEALSTDECDGAGVSDSTFDAFVEAEEELSADLRVAETSPEFPYAVLMYPLEVDLSIRLSLTDGLLELVNATDEGELLNAFIGEGELVRVSREDFEALQTFLDEVGYDFAQLGD